MGKETNLAKVIRLKVKDVYKNNFSATLDMKNLKEVKKSSIMIRESELVRIVQCLNPEDNPCTKLNKKERKIIPFIKDLIILKVGKHTSNFEEMVKLEKIQDCGIITFNDKRYKYLMCSSSSVRGQKAVFINENLFDKANEILLCGIPADAKHKVFAKYNSYYGLASTDSIPVSMPRIVVIEDYETPVLENFDVVTRNKIKNKRGNKYYYEYSVINDVEKEFKILPFDGGGLVSVQKMEQWQKELKLDYLPSAVQFRCIAGIKGNLYTFDLRAFAQQYPDAKIKGIDNIDYDIKDIDAILTRSQFKFANMYGDNEFGGVNIQAWKDAFETDLYGYKRTFNISEYSEPLKELKNIALTSYQPMQTLQFKAGEIEKLCKTTVETIKKISTNIDDFLRYRGLENDESDEDKKKTKTPPYYEALLKNHSLCNDPYIKDRIKEDLKEIKRRSYCSKLIVSGNYQVFTPDIYALAQWAFGQEVTGLLGAYEVYSNYWNRQFNIPVNEYLNFCDGMKMYNENGERVTNPNTSTWHSVPKIDVIRSPHIANEHQVVNVVQSEDMINWYKYQDTGIVTSIKDSLAMKLNSGDYDGDHILTISDNIIISAAERDRSNTILFYDIPNANELKIDKVGVSINDMKELIHTNVIGMKNNIGSVVNKISVLWSLPQTDEIQDYIKIMSIIGSLTIDFVKTGEKASIPRDIYKLVRQYKKPEWMRCLKKKDLRQDNKTISNAELIGQSSENARSFEYRECTVQKICDYMKQEIDKINIEFKGYDKFSFTSLIQNKVYSYNTTYPKVKQKLIELQEDYGTISNEIYNEGDENAIQKDENDMTYRTFFNYCQDELLLISNNVDKILDYMVTAYYTEPELISVKNKAILWNSFPSEIISRCKDINFTNEVIVDNKKLKARAEKAKKTKLKVQKIKDSSRMVSIKFLKDNKNKIIINKDEIEHIKKLIPEDSNSQRVFYVLLGLYRKIGKEFLICKGQKEQVTETQICKMADIESRAYKNSIKNLIGKGLISINGTGKTGQKFDVLCCNVNFEGIISDAKSEEYETVNDFAKNIPKLFPKIAKNKDVA